MQPRDTISTAISAASAHGSPALVGFLTAGFPTRRQFRDNLLAVAAACDVVEIGVPFSDPMADGSTVQRASFAALADGVTLPWILEELAQLPRPLAAPMLLMSYLNPLLAFGLEALPRAAREAGVAGFIVPDLPYEESGDLMTALATFPDAPVYTTISLEAAGDNFILGGSDPSIPGLTPTRVVISGNTISKPQAWHDARSPWQVKNLLELKNARVTGSSV